MSKRLSYKSDCRLSRRGDLSSKWRRRLPSMRATRPSPISRSHLPPRNVLPARAVCERARVCASLPIRGPAPVPSQPRQVLAPCRAARPRATIAVARDRRCTQLHSLLSACRWHATERTCATTCLSSPLTPAGCILAEQLQELLERECEMQVKRLQEESTRMQNRLRETAGTALACAAARPRARSSRPLATLRTDERTTGEAREILLAAPTKHNEAKLETFLRESLGASK